MKTGKSNSIEIWAFDNQVELFPYKNGIELSPPMNSIDVELIQILTPYSFVSPFQPSIIKVG